MKQCLLLFTFLCVAILPSFSQQKIDILGNAGKEQEIKLSEVAKSVRVIPLEKYTMVKNIFLYVIKENRELFIASQRMESFLIR